MRHVLQKIRESKQPLEPNNKIENILEMNR